MDPLLLRSMESFFVGGRTRSLTSSVFGPDELVLGAMYVQRLVPVEKSFDLPLVLIHGGVHTGATWETTPDGREGWQTLFTRAGFETLVVDQYARGRSAPDLTGLNPTYADADRVGPGAVTTIGKVVGARLGRGGARFPLDHLHEYASQLWPDFTVPKSLAKGHPGLSDDAAVAPLAALLDRIGPAVLVTHSQGGHLGWRVTLARPEHVRGIVAIEPGVTAPGLDDPSFPDIPVLVMWGDNLPDDGVTLTMRDVRIARALAEQRPRISVDVLPEHGIFGNGHMLMMEDNNDVLAERVMAWLRGTHADAR